MLELPSFTSVLQGIATVSVLGVAAVLGAIYTFQRKLIYIPSFPQNSRTEVWLPSRFGMMEGEEIWFKSGDGKTLLHGYFIPAATVNSSESVGKLPAILYCHANAGNMGHRLPVVAALRQSIPNTHVFIFSYRGYGKSEGTPDESGMKLDADSALEWLRQHPLVNGAVVYGQSIGGAVAIHLATKKENNQNNFVKGLIVENTFTSIPDVIPKLMPFLSWLAWLCHQKWNSLAAIQKAGGDMRDLPFLLISGTQDEMIDPIHSKKLFEASASERKELRMIEGGTHNDTCFQPIYYQIIRDFWEKNINH